MGTPDHCKYLPIRDAVKFINQKVNIAGIILDLGFPRRTRGTDYCCTLRIIDESYGKPGISVNIFAESSERLPRVVASGDVVQFCNVLIQTHGDEVNAIFNKRISSFALYNGKDNDYFVPYQVSSKFHPRDMDKALIDKLRKWLVSFKLIEDSSNFPMLREIKEGDCFVDLACKILHCCETANHEWMVFIWDGTDLPPNSISANPEDEMHDPLPLHLEPEPLPRELLCSFPTVGSILRITYGKDIEKNHLKFLDVSKWVKIVNMHLEVRAGLWHGVFIPTTKLRYTPKDDNLIQERERLYGERMSLNCGKMPFSSLPWTSCITVVDHNDVPFATLMDVLTHSQVTAKFKCIVRVVAAMPWPAEKFRSEHGIYRMRLTLEDPTARIHAYVYAEDGVTLFDGHPDTCILMQKMNMLLGVMSCDDSTVTNCVLRNPPWVQLCIKSYYTSKHDVWGSRKYRIFDTKIVGGV
ncbi:protection of telomeres protein 1b-like [Neltuma alba]|uniref:protection of telomeres protein 1b-like n=1 Tax=Neltuma alba TaxID=207710 RepID=UPI0010A47729|nr:protection of telomeres protein 1b-like [Prosopis alba]